MYHGGAEAGLVDMCAVLAGMPGLQYVSMGAHEAMLNCEDGPGGWLCRLPGGFTML